jgi:MoxR-like ATPase
MEFHVYETHETIRAVERPIVVITSNNEKELPDAFLRRCFFHYIRFPDRETMQAIIDVHFPGIQQMLVARRSTSSTRFARCRASRRSRRPAS